MLLELLYVCFFVCFVRGFAFDDCKWLYWVYEKLENKNSRKHLIITYIIYTLVIFNLYIFIYN